MAVVAVNAGPEALRGTLALPPGWTLAAVHGDGSATQLGDRLALELAGNCGAVPVMETA